MRRMETSIAALGGAAALGLSAVGTLWNDHGDWITFGVALLILVTGALLLIARHSRMATQRLKDYHDLQMKITRHHLARAAWMGRRKMREHQRMIREIYEIVHEDSEKLAAVSSAEKRHIPRLERLELNVTTVFANQADLLDHFHARMKLLEDRWFLAHDKAVARIALRGVHTSDEDK